MQQPVLLDSDIILLAGAEPSAQLINDGLLEMKYIIELQQVHRNSNYDVPIFLQFRKLHGQYRLQQSRIDKDLREFLKPAIVDYSFRTGCTVQPDLLRTRLEIDLSDLDKSQLPTRDEILTTLGPPLETSPNGDMITYQYRLKSAEPDSISSRAIMWFEPSSVQLRRVFIRHRYYEMDADLVADSAVVKLKL